MKKVFHTRVYPIYEAVGAKKVVVNYRGYYTLEKSGPRQWRALGTPSREIAQKRILEQALLAQKVQEGFALPEPQQKTVLRSISALFEDYREYLHGQGRAKKHVHDTVARLKRMAAEIRWKGATDIRPDAFQAWQTGQKCSQKTKKEYQVSACAFLNWLVGTERLPANPLAKLAKPDIRGKQVRPSRAYTADEIARLLLVAGKFALGYQFLLYTACRWSEAYAVVWDDLHLDGNAPYVLFREGTTKDKDRRRVDLKAELVELLRAVGKPTASTTSRVLLGRLAGYDLFRKHLVRASIERIDRLGRVVHLHSFRMTWQTWGAGHGVNQRAAQDVLGHSDPGLTAKIYTDLSGLGMRDEMAKLPWITPSKANAQADAQKGGIPSLSMSLGDILSAMAAKIKAAGSEQLDALKALRDTLGHEGKLGAGAGFEPATFRL